MIDGPVLHSDGAFLSGAAAIHCAVNCYRICDSKLVEQLFNFVDVDSIADVGVYG